MIESEYKIYKTKEYNKFKILKGNRTIPRNRVEKIKQSIEEVGYIINPIIVNENFEIIDGQGRFTALQESDKDIYYIIAENTGLKECISMNMSNTKWGYNDFIKSYAEQGNVNYKRFADLVQKYKVAGVNTVYCALRNLFKVDCRKVKDGSLIITEEEYLLAEEKLKKFEWLANVNRSKLSGPITILYEALVFLYGIEEIDINKISNKIEKNLYNMRKFSDIFSCFDAIEEIYNYGLRGEHCFVSTLAKKKMYKTRYEARLNACLEMKRKLEE